MAFSPSDSHLIVNYHYVQDPRPDFSGIFPCALKEFERQISFLAHAYRCVSVPELYASAKKGEGKKLCAITFDDGLRGHYLNAVPVLKKYGADATFFIITSTLEGRVPSAHKIHVAGSHISMAMMRKKFNRFLLKEFPYLEKDFLIPEEGRLTQKWHRDDAVTANVKHTLTVIPREISETFLTSVCAELGIDEAALSKELFMNASEIAELAGDGFFIESHTHRHVALDTADEKTMQNDFHAADIIFKNILGKSPTVMAYPHGRAPKTDAVLNEYGFRYGVTVESRAVSGKDKVFSLPRFDTNEIKDFLNTSHA